MDEFTQSILMENAALKERCFFLQRQLDQQALEMGQLKKMYEDLVQKIVETQRYYTPPTIIPNVPFQYSKGCPKCGIGADGGPLGYVCNDPECPCGLGGVRCSTDTMR